MVLNVSFSSLIPSFIATSSVFSVEVKVNETVISLSTDINEIKSNVQLIEQEVKDQREITLNSLNEVKNDSKDYCIGTFRDCAICIVILLVSIIAVSGACWLSINGTANCSNG
jgi:D-ribose pyranose/furanose isomerase RbsD